MSASSRASAAEEEAAGASVARPMRASRPSRCASPAPSTQIRSGVSGGGSAPASSSASTADATWRAMRVAVAGAHRAVGQQRRPAAGRAAPGRPRRRGRRACARRRRRAGADARRSRAAARARGSGWWRARRAAHRRRAARRHGPRSGSRASRTAAPASSRCTASIRYPPNSLPGCTAPTIGFRHGSHPPGRRILRSPGLAGARRRPCGDREPHDEHEMDGGAFAGRARRAAAVVPAPRRGRAGARRAPHVAVLPRDLDRERLPDLLDVLPPAADRRRRGPGVTGA